MRQKCQLSTLVTEATKRCLVPKHAGKSDKKSPQGAEKKSVVYVLKSFFRPQLLPKRRLLIYIGFKIVTNLSK